MKEFLNYWLENFKEAKDRFDFVMYGWFCLSVLFAIAYWINGTHNSFGEFVEEHKLDKFAEISAGLILFLYGLLWLPYKRHEIEKKRPNEKDARIAALEQELKQRADIKYRELFEHDRAVFKRLDAIADETKLNAFCSEIKGRYNYYTRDFGRFFRDLRDFGQKTEDRFLIDTLKEKFARFHSSFDELIKFMGHTFSPVEGENRATFGGPLLSSDPDIRKMTLTDAADRLLKLNENAKLAYTEFRKEVNNTLLL